MQAMPPEADGWHGCANDAGDATGSYGRHGPDAYGGDAT